MNKQCISPAIISPVEIGVGLERFYLNAFRRIGANASLHPFWPVAETSRLVDLYRRSPLLSLHVRRRAERIAEQLDKSQSDVVLIVKLPELSSEAISILRGRGRKVVCIYPDSPAVYPGLHDPRLLESTSAYDGVVTFSRALVPVWYQLGAKAVARIPFAHSPDIHFPVTEVEGAFRRRVAYLGAAGPLQRHWLATLKEWEPAVYGVGWSSRSKARKLFEIFSHSPRTLPGYGEELRKACSGSEIVFNMVRSEHGCAHSMKTFEIPACGAFTICNRTEEQLEFFREDKEAVYFDCIEELHDKLRYYLSAPSARRQIAQAGCEEAKKYTYERRAEELSAFVRGL